MESFIDTHHWRLSSPLSDLQWYDIKGTRGSAAKDHTFRGEEIQSSILESTSIRGRCFHRQWDCLTRQGEPHTPTGKRLAFATPPANKHTISRPMHLSIVTESPCLFKLLARVQNDRGVRRSICQFSWLNTTSRALERGIIGWMGTVMLVVMVVVVITKGVTEQRKRINEYLVWPNDHLMYALTSL